MVDGQEQAQAFAQKAAAAAEKAGSAPAAEAEPSLIAPAPSRDEPRVPRREAATAV